jgi:uncharacterized protein involved in outer membrane biogenesis
MRKSIKFLILGVVAVLVILGAAAFFFLGNIVKAGVERVGPMITKTDVQLDGAVISVFNGSGELKGFTLGNPEGFKTTNAIHVGSIGLKLKPSSVLDKKVVIHSIRVEAPEITYEAALGGSNIGQLLDNIKATASQSQGTSTNASGTQKALEVDDFLITGGKIHVTASILGGQTATLPLPEIHLTNLGQRPEGITPAELSVKVFSELVDEVAKMVTKDAAKIGGAIGDKAKSLGTEAQDRLKKASSGVSDLLKSKTK